MRLQHKILLGCCIIATLFSSGCLSLNGQSAATNAGAWEVLFDGNSTDLWRGFKQHGASECLLQHEKTTI